MLCIFLIVFIYLHLTVIVDLSNVVVLQIVIFSI